MSHTKNETINEDLTVTTSSEQLEKKAPRVILIIFTIITAVLCIGTVAFAYIFIRLIQPSL